jgi:hypothetical protein
VDIIRSIANAKATPDQAERFKYRTYHDSIGFCALIQEEQRKYRERGKAYEARRLEVATERCIDGEDLPPVGRPLLMADAPRRSAAVGVGRGGAGAQGRGEGRVGGAGHERVSAMPGSEGRPTSRSVGLVQATSQ